MDNKFYLFRKIISCVILLLCLPGIHTYAQVYANSQSNGVTGICLLCGVSNPDNAVNNANLTDFSTLRITAGLLGVTVYQTLIFPSGSSIGCDSLIVSVGSSSTVLSVGLLAGVTVQTFNGATPNNDLQAVGTGNLRLLSYNRGEIILKPANVFDRVKIILNSNVIGLLTALDLYYAQRKSAIPPPVAPDSTAICQGSGTTLTATGISGATIRWYNAANGGTVLFTGNNYPVNPAVTTVYYAAAEVGNCQSSRKAVKVVVHPRPANPAYTLPQGALCGTVSVPITNHINGLNYNVYVFYKFPNKSADTAFTVINRNTLSIPDPNGFQHAQTEVYVQAVNPITGCVSDTVHKTYVLGGHSTIPDVDADSVVICKYDSTTLHGFTPLSTFSTIRWYTAPVGGTLLHTGNFYKVSPDTTTTYYASGAIVCEYPVRRAVKVIVRKLPDPDYTVPSGMLCGFPVLPVHNHQPGFNYNVRLVYTPIFGSGTFDTSFVVINSNNIPTPYYINEAPAVVDVYVQATDPLTGCRSDKVQMVFTTGGYSRQPSADADTVTICRGDSATLHAFSAVSNTPTIRWYNAPNGGTLLHTGNYYKVSPPAGTTYYASAAYECEHPLRKAVRVQVNNCLGQTVSTAATISKTPTVKQLKLFPNPTQGMLKLYEEKELTGSIIIIKNIAGFEVQRGVFSNDTFYLSAHLAPGIYFVQVITKAGTVHMAKIIYQP
ncbi:Ig-like domain-containing protein [Chitinophaga nivalis]|uniref:T9SS type A sorting domain-containing protein n=1 Tax=Chitinophaga nivalis TaxID=2991709 RepID=A0ABT3IPJ0_9BACT|nr:T9SS type A sorting domain-containing protein [Chitinophaga nivalis]MCW3464424.1 T9SS type A sorting domain-containing protein [Chitinophaga nivalis]MCW3485885.1 T9SS type A sorting domain-containing protein [Chitinophaga nivalis]